MELLKETAYFSNYLNRCLSLVLLYGEYWVWNALYPLIIIINT